MQTADKLAGLPHKFWSLCCPITHVHQIYQSWSIRSCHVTTRETISPNRIRRLIILLLKKFLLSLLYYFFNALTRKIENILRMTQVFLKYGSTTQGVVYRIERRKFLAKNIRLFAEVRPMIINGITIIDRFCLLA